MLGRLSARELTDWQAYERVAGPLGPERHDALAALSSFYVLKAAGVKKVKLSQLMPRWDRPEPMGWQQMKMLAVAITKEHGGTVNE